MTAPRPHGESTRARDGRGSVLMLMPAGLLVVMLLGAISFDMSVVFLRQRQASSTAADVANDLASAALDAYRYRATGAFVLDEDRADELGARYVTSSDVGPMVEDIDVDVNAGGDTVTVTLVVRVDYVFARAIPGANEGTTVTATATAVAAAG